MAYESPIRLVTEIENKIIEDQEEGVYKAILAYKIDISKDELFKLLYGDRKQYDKGYSDGRADATKHGRWMPYEFGNERWHKCSVCGKADEYIDFFGLEAIRNYCPNCGAKMDEQQEVGE